MSVVKTLKGGASLFLFITIIGLSTLYSQDITEDYCRNSLSSYYSFKNSWQKYLTLSESQILGKDGQVFYDFTTNKSDLIRNKRYWRRKDELPSRTFDKPLKGVRITIDPGHIGGKCAKMEERWFQLNDDLPVQEGEMTLYVAKLIKPKLEELGALVSFTRESNEPVADKNSPHLDALIREKTESLDPESPETQKYIDKLFYRTMEINARAYRVNHVLKPDLVIALHLNAVEWGDPEQPELVEDNHFHLLVNGAYMEQELNNVEQMTQLLQRLIYRTQDEEIALAHSFVKGFVSKTQLPAYNYGVDAKNAIRVDSKGYIWARNLLANRIYQCPVVFLEPYVMNSKDVYARVQVGDYQGKKVVRGKKCLSLYREYTEAVVESLINYYTPIPLVPRAKVLHIDL